jgi:hypothetical protein
MGVCNRKISGTWSRAVCVGALQILLLAPGFAAHGGMFASIGTGYSLERAANGRDFEIRQPFAARAGYRFVEADLFLEYSRFKSHQGVPSVEVTREHSEVLLWVRRVLTERWCVLPFAAIGSGIQFEAVTTRFNTETRDDHGSPGAMAAVAAGAQVFMFGNLELVLEGRMSFSANFAPNPLPGAGVFVGWVF